MWADSVRVFTTPGALLRSIARLTIGLIFLLFALALVATVLTETHPYSIVATAIVVAGLVADLLAGDGIRAGIGLRR